MLLLPLYQILYAFRYVKLSSCQQLEKQTKNMTEKIVSMNDKIENDEELHFDFKKIFTIVNKSHFAV